MTSVTYKIILAFLIGGLIGIERGKHGRAAGMRTHILICVGASLAAIIGINVSTTYGSTDPTRIAAQIIASSGVIGAGTILIRRGSIVEGLTTAAGLWSTAIIGLAIGFGLYEGALVTAILTIIAMAILNYFEFSKIKEIRLYMELNDAKKINSVIDKIKRLDKNKKNFYVSSPKSNIDGNVGLYLTEYVKKGFDHEKLTNDLINNINNNVNVVYIIEE